MQKLKKVLIIRFSSIGDIVLTTPVIRCLKVQTGCEIHFLTKSAFSGILETNPFIDKLIVLDKLLLCKAADLKNENYDLVIDLHNNLRTKIFKSVLGINSFAFEKLNLEKLFTVLFKGDILPNLHIVDRYLATLAKLKVSNDFDGLDFFIRNKSEIDLTSLGLESNKFISWAIGAQHFTKKLPNSKIAAICNKLNKNIVLLGGKEDEKNAAEIEKLAPRIINLCGKLDIHQSAWIVQNSILLLSNDTGMMHIGAALKKPVFSFWGNTIPAFGMTPYYGKHKTFSKKFEVKNLSCRPCTKLGSDSCPKSHFNCMNMISENEILEEINRIITK